MEIVWSNSTAVAYLRHIKQLYLKVYNLSRKGEKKATMQRPMIEESVSESDWSFFLPEWDRYVEVTDLSDDEEAAVRHLWQACSDGLRRALHNDRARELWEVKELLARIKSLCVQRRNNLVNILTLQKMGQERDEGVLAFMTRLNGQVCLCDLNVKCACAKQTCRKPAHPHINVEDNHSPGGQLIVID